MQVLYADEFGHDGLWSPGDPRHSHHPLFGLAGFSVPLTLWRDLDRRFFRLKLNFYAREITDAIATKVIRPERFEPKELDSRRDIRFAGGVLDLITGLRGVVFAYGQQKPTAATRHNSDALYGSTMQGLMRAYERFLRHRDLACGMMVLDRRNERRDVELLASARRSSSVA